MKSNYHLINDTEDGGWLYKRVCPRCALHTDATKCPDGCGGTVTVEQWESVEEWGKKSTVNKTSKSRKSK